MLYLMTDPLLSRIQQFGHKDPLQRGILTHSFIHKSMHVLSDQVSFIEILEGNPSIHLVILFVTLQRRYVDDKAVLHLLINTKMIQQALTLLDLCLYAIRLAQEFF